MIDILFKGEYPANALSNFYPNEFIFDGVWCRSMESFLQSLKYKNTKRQVEVCRLQGKKAKKNALAKKWYKKQYLWWKGMKYKRDGLEYQQLLDRAYHTLFVQNENFRQALKNSQNKRLVHSIGKQNISETILTEQEFCHRLMNLR